MMSFPKTITNIISLILFFSMSQVLAESKYRFNDETAKKYLEGEYDLPSFEETSKDAEKGDVYAQSRLGDLYNSGQGVLQNTEKAIYWYRKALEKGDNRAPFVLAGMYESGNSTVRKFYKNEITLYRIAAKRGYIPAQVKLGGAYASGEGVPKDYITAYAWWNIAAAQGDNSAALRRDELASHMTKHQVEKGQGLSKNIMKNNGK